jgi:hypothetical protein
MNPRQHRDKLAATLAGANTAAVAPAAVTEHSASGCRAVRLRHRRADRTRRSPGQAHANGATGRHIVPWPSRAW